MFIILCNYLLAISDVTAPELSTAIDGVINCTLLQGYKSRCPSTPGGIDADFVGGNRLTPHAP